MQTTSAPRAKKAPVQKVLTPEQVKAQKFLQEHPADPQNLINMYDSLNDLQKKQGRNWYPSANLIAHHIAKIATQNTGRNVTADQVVGHMANYSGQTQWHNNMHEAFLAAHGIYPGEHGAGWRSPIDGKGFMATNKQAEISRKIGEGQDWRTLLSPVKEGSFGQNISAGGAGTPVHVADGPPDLQSRDGRYHLTTDRHHVSAAHGAYADENAYRALGLQRPENYDRYTDMTVDAAKRISDRDPSKPPMHPVSLQASVWLGQQASNAAGGYTDPKSASRSIGIAAANKGRFENLMDIHGAEHLKEKAPVVGFPGTGGALALDFEGDIPVVQTYHGMPAHNGQPMTEGPTPTHTKSPRQNFLQQQLAMNNALGQAGMKPNTVKDIAFDPSHGGQHISHYLDLATQHGGYDSSHVQATNGEQFPHFHDTPKGQASLQALTDAGMPTPNRQTNFVPKLPKVQPVQQVAASLRRFFVRTAGRAKKGWSYSPTNDQYRTSDLTAKFACNCGERFTPCGFYRCACGASWASFTIEGQGKTASSPVLVVRSVAEHRNRVLAKTAAFFVRSNGTELENSAVPFFVRKPSGEDSAPTLFEDDANHQ